MSNDLPVAAAHMHNGRPQHRPSGGQEVLQANYQIKGLLL